MKSKIHELLLKNKLNVSKKTLLFLSLIATSFYGISQTQTFDWAKQMGGTNLEEGVSISTDVFGNIYTLGNFSGTVDFDPGPGTFNKTALGNGADIFIQKLDENGNLLWVKTMGGYTDDNGRSITIDVNGNVYSTGYFTGLADFDPSGGTFNLSAGSSAEIFIQKLDANGNFLWAKQNTGASYEVATCISTDANGNVFITGYFDGTVDFDSGPGTTNLTTIGDADGFVQKLDANGNLLWVKQIGGIGNQSGNSLVTDASGNVYTTGYFQAIVDFDPGTGAFNLNTAGGKDIFIQKLDPNGNFVWANKMGGVGDDVGNSITIGAGGSVYTTGYFRSIVDFDPGVGVINLTSTSLGYSDIFIQQLDANGNYVSAIQTGGINKDEGGSIKTDAAGNVYTTGFFKGTVDFDPGGGTVNLTSAGGQDVFIQKIDISGNLVWVKQMGGAGNDIGKAIATVYGKVYTTGSFEGTANFDTELGAVNYTSAGYTDVFIQKLGCNTMRIDTIVACNSYTWVDGNIYTSSDSTTTYVLPNAEGCDSIVTLNLTINNSNTGVDTQIACDSYIWIDGNTYNANNTTAIHTLPNAAGCDSIITLNLTINSFPITTISQNGLDLTADLSNVTYQWIDCDNNNVSIVGETSQTFEVTTNGNYAVVVNNGNCSDTSNCISIDNVGIGENEPSGFNISPNPTNNTINIQSKTIIQQISIIDINDRVILNQKVNTKIISNLDVSALNNGVYFIKVIDIQGDLTVSKIIKQ